MDTTAQLGLPLLQASQAMKHVTLNEALLTLDALVQLRLRGDGSGQPPPNAEDGEAHWTGDVPGGDWSGRAGRIARFSDGAWEFHRPEIGWTAWRETDERLCQFDGFDWQPLSLHTEPWLGINAIADAVNRFALRSEAALFDNLGGSVQVKLNSTGSGGVSSLLFQRDYVGHGE